jgi:chemotaxis protein histidine kinase CheA
VKEMLEKIGGHIDVGSDLGVGTKMFLTLKNFKK